jgi:hypothetical protein
MHLRYTNNFTMPQVDIDALVSKLTLEEKLSLLAGESTWRTCAIPRLGIPNLKVSSLGLPMYFFICDADI